MNPLQMGVMACSVSCATLSPATLVAQVEPPQPATLNTQGTSNMTPAEQIQRLQPAHSPEELMHLLRAVHEHCLLLEHSFMEDENIRRLLGDGRIDTSIGVEHQVAFVAKHFFPATDFLMEWKRIYFGSSRASESRLGTMTFHAADGTRAISSHLLETILMPEFESIDPIRPGQTNETMDSISRLSPKLHPKGYLNYYGSIKNSGCKSRASAKLDRAGMVEWLSISQELERK